MSVQYVELYLLALKCGNPAGHGKNLRFRARTGIFPTGRPAANRFSLSYGLTPKAAV